MAEKWNPPVELSEREERILKLTKKRKLYEFFRRYRDRILDDEVQDRLLGTYGSTARGKDALPPAQMALAMLMQAAFGVADHEVPTLTAVDMRWQVVLDCLGTEEPVVSQGTVYNFRQRANAHGLNRLLMDKTVKLARETKGFDAKRLQAAFDSSPLAGAGRVDDTFNLLGRAASKAVRSAAAELGETPESIAESAGIPLVTASSIKVALDLDWDDPQARRRGLNELLQQIRALECWVASQAENVNKAAEKPLATVARVIAQDTEPTEDRDVQQITQGVAADRQISVSDPEMRHGRKSKTVRIDGFKRHVAVDLSIKGLICASIVTPANERDHTANDKLFERLEEQNLDIESVHIDRGYVDEDAFAQRRAQGLRVVTKPHPTTNTRNPDLFAKTDFSFDFNQSIVTCPGGAQASFVPGSIVKFSPDRCQHCDLRSRCTTAVNGRGRTLRIAKDERFQHDLRNRLRTPDGRAELRKRVDVEHALARIGHLQGRRARYKGVEKNNADLERQATVNNCYILNALWNQNQEQTALAA